VRAALGLAAFLAAFEVMFAAAPAQAADNDFRLNATKNGDGVLFHCSNPALKIAQCTGSNFFVPDDAAFAALATQLGYVFSPRLASPAETLGHSGFHVGILWSGTSVSSDQAYWNVTERAADRGDGTGGGSPRGFLQTLQLEVRKGLPFSFELGANFMWLVESQLFAPGLEVRWALQEGYKYIPDIGFRGSVNHMVGNRDMLLTTVGLDAVVSKSFGLFGMVNVAPYASWSLIFIAASSRVIDPTPTIEGDVSNNIVFKEVGATDKIHHKLTLGVRTIYYVLNVSVQGEFQMAEGSFFGPVATITTKLGLDF
jgi:hypothetical protein